MSLYQMVVTGLYLLTLFIFWLGGLMIVYHLIRFGIGVKPKKLIIIFLSGAIFLTFISFVTYNTALKMKPKITPLKVTPLKTIKK